jgi:hypothetical protein
MTRDVKKAKDFYAKTLALLADPDFLAELRGLNGRALPGRTRAENEQVKLFHDLRILRGRVKRVWRRRSSRSG